MNDMVWCVVGMVVNERFSLAALRVLCKCCCDKAGENGVGMIGLGLELWVELRADKEGVIGDLNNFHKAGRFGDRADFEAGSLDLLAVCRVEFVAMAVALTDRVLTVERVSNRTGENLRVTGT